MVVQKLFCGKNLMKGVINLLATSDPQKIKTFDVSAINLGQLSAHFQLNSSITIAISVPALVIFIAAVIVAIFLIVIYIMLCLQRRHVSRVTKKLDFPNFSNFSIRRTFWCVEIFDWPKYGRYMAHCKTSFEWFSYF